MNKIKCVVSLERRTVLESNKKPQSAILSLSNDHDNSLSVVIEGRQMTIRSDNPLFNAAVEAFKQSEWENLYNLILPENVVRQAAVKFGDINVIDGRVTYRGIEVHNLVVERILHFIQEGFDVLPLVKFLHKLMKNPSMRSVTELYRFLERNELTVTETGNFLGYKAVRPDWYSITSGKVHLLKGTQNGEGRILNRIGEEIEIERNNVDDDAEKGCSYGLHVGTLEYAQGFMQHGGKLLIVEVDPSYVVSVPNDCNCTKLRTSAYKVVDECKARLEDRVYNSRYSTRNDEDFDEYDD